MSKTLSIIIPTFNRAALLDRLLGQLVTQTLPPHEIIVVDDRSTDHTRKVARKWMLLSPRVRYTLNDGSHLADGRQTGMRRARGEYLSFIDDDVIIDDPGFLAKLNPLLHPQVMIQPKVIMENFGQKPEQTLTFSDILATRPYPILELIYARLNRGLHPRPVFPFNELGVFWHHSLNHTWIDKKLIGDAYGQSFSTALRLREQNVKILFRPELVLRHPGAESGGSKKFNKKLMTEDFTSFHYDYFYNMVYLNARWFPRWVWLWVPYFFLKSIVALAINQNLYGWHQYALSAIRKSLSDHLGVHHPSLTTTYSLQPTTSHIFVWQGNWHGGAERVTLAIAQQLAKRGLNVTLGTFKKNTSISLRQETYPSFSYLPQPFRALAASLVFRQRAQQYQAVYTHTLGAWKTKRNKVFVHEAADLDRKLEQTQGMIRKSAYWLWRQLYLTLTLKQADCIFAATPECARYLTGQNIKAERIKESGSFFDESIFRFTHHPAPQQPVRIITIGNWQDPAKNFHLTKRLFRNNPDYIVIVCGGPTHPPEANITYHGYLAPKQLATELARADIFFMPSTSEGFSIGLLEALATGIPCLINHASVPENLSKEIPNMITYQNERVIPRVLDGIVSTYTNYNVHTPHLKKFSQSDVVAQEISRIKEALGLGNGEALRLSGRKSVSGTG